MEADFVAASEMARETIVLREVLSDFGIASAIPM